MDYIYDVIKYIQHQNIKQKSLVIRLEKHRPRLNYQYKKLGVSQSGLNKKIIVLDQCNNSFHTLTVSIARLKLVLIRIRKRL